MSLLVDTSAPWRSVALGAGLSARRVEMRAAVKGHGQGNVSEEVGVTDKSTDSWLRDSARVAVSEEAARNGMMTGVISADVEVSAIDAKSSDSALSRLNAVPYDYTGGNSTVVEYTFAGKCFVVRPAINTTVVDAMYSAPTADKWAQATGIKLPRVIAQGQAPGAVAGMPNPASAQQQAQQGFDSLRKHVVSCARGDDYGDRLFNLARVVLHAQVLHTLRKRPEVTPAMQTTGGARSIAAADTPNLTPTQLMDARYTYLYVHTDTSADYRAFLSMGVRGVQNYTGAFGSVYSACTAEAEARADDELVFVRVGGDAPSPVGPGADAYTRVLSNPASCLAYYYAYASSMGLGGLATAVLAQAAHAPHIWGSRAISPYRTGQPRLDACTYVLLPDQDVAHVVLDDVRQLVHSAAIVANAYKAAIGGALMSYKSNRQVDDSLVVEQYVERLTDPEARRPLLRSITACLYSGTIGLEWLSPFSYDVQSGYQSCVAAYRDYGYLLAMYNRCPVGALTALFSTGVDMANSMVGHGIADSQGSYAQTTGVLIAAGCQLLGACERWPVRLTAQLPQVAALTRGWKLVVTLVRFVAVQPHTTKLEDSPGKWSKEVLQESTTATGDIASVRSSPAAPAARPDIRGTHSRQVSETAVPIKAVLRKPKSTGGAVVPKAPTETTGYVGAMSQQVYPGEYGPTERNTDASSSTVRRTRTSSSSLQASDRTRKPVEVKERARQAVGPPKVDAAVGLPKAGATAETKPTITAAAQPIKTLGAIPGHKEVSARARRGWEEDSEDDDDDAEDDADDSGEEPEDPATAQTRAVTRPIPQQKQADSPAGSGKGSSALSGRAGSSGTVHTAKTRTMGPSDFSV
ncbi:MAG: hypothetical protein KM766_s4gp1 [Neofusicoccum parvum chrysovirus 1]|uniref:hypothetical protein n=1 Tax=Neofusicoccum parvum chrysovirus 1 TaxID=2587541 RepID=UPI001BE91377|nr:MAG: hypothetical protein KM766_s4gp1 [Neofusicoccum parvum chrysovirus 1]QDB74978.1 MAG: hypothetical protein [Neofusicoccum parvum chrysovirus 1]